MTDGFMKTILPPSGSPTVSEPLIIHRARTQNQSGALCQTQWLQLPRGKCLDNFLLYFFHSMEPKWGQTQQDYVFNEGGFLLKYTTLTYTHLEKSLGLSVFEGEIKVPYGCLVNQDSKTVPKAKFTLLK